MFQAAGVIKLHVTSAYVHRPSSRTASSHHFEELYKFNHLTFNQVYRSVSNLRLGSFCLKG